MVFKDYMKYMESSIVEAPLIGNFEVFSQLSGVFMLVLQCELVDGLVEGEVQVRSI